MNSVAVRTIVALFVLTLSAPATVAEADAPPIEVPRPDLPYGYNWAELPGYAHVTVDGTVATIDIATIDRPWLALEVTRLKEGHEYKLSAVGQDSLRAFVPPNANAIFWGVPVRPLVWSLEDETTHEQVGLVKLVSSSLTLNTAIIMVKPGYHPKPPTPTGTERGEGVTTNQAAYSFTSDIVIKTTSCWAHATSVRPYVTAGTAAGSATAGATLTYQRSVCWSIQSSGSPTKLRGLDSFQVDQYEDGSTKAYLTARGNGVSVESFGYYPPPTDAISVYVEDTTDPIEATVTERGTAGVYFSGRTGAEFLGYGMGTTISNDGTQDSLVKVTINPPTTGPHEYKVKFVSGDGAATGIVGQAWKVG